MDGRVLGARRGREGEGRLGSGEVERQQRGRAAASGRMGGGRAGSPSPPPKKRTSAGAARKRAESLRHLRKVVCSWGRKGLSPGPARCISSPSVARIAALREEGKRSPMMRMSGPARLEGVCVCVGLVRVLGGWGFRGEF